MIAEWLYLYRFKLLALSIATIAFLIWLTHAIAPRSGSDDKTRPVESNTKGSAPLIGAKPPPPIPKSTTSSAGSKRSSADTLRALIDEAASSVQLHGDPLLEQSQFIETLPDEERAAMLDRFVAVNQYWLAAVLTEMAKSDLYKPAIVAALNDPQFREFLVSSLGSVFTPLNENLGTGEHITESDLTRLFPQSSSEILDSSHFATIESTIPPDEAERLARSIVSRVIADILWWHQQQQAGLDSVHGSKFKWLFWKPE